jgi:myosin heavy subunit
MQEEPAPIKAYNTQQLASLYDVSCKTMRKWLTKFKAQLDGEQLGRRWNLKQVQIIFNHLGHPTVPIKPTKS